MKKLALLLLVSLLGAAWTQADEIPGVSVFNRSAITPRLSHLSIGLGAETMGGDIGLGASVTSPFFLSDTLSFRAGFMEFANHGQDFAKKTDGSLRPYSLLKFGPVFAYPAFGDRFRLSFASGVAYLFQTSAYSAFSGPDTLKGYLALEAEYLPRGLPDVSLYLDLGAMQDSHADKYDPLLVYAGGFDASVGLRHYF